MKLRYTPRAIADLREVLAYIEEQSPQGARRVRARIQRLINLTLDHPYTRARTGSKRLRRLIARPYPYLIFYEVADDEVVIHGVPHGARRPTSIARLTLALVVHSIVMDRIGRSTRSEARTSGFEASLGEHQILVGE